MTITDINTRVNDWTNTTTTEYSAASRLISLNKWYNLVHSWILQSQDEWDYDDSNKTDFPVLTTSLVANQQDYSLPSGTIRIKRLEITYDGVNWYKAEPFDINERGTATDTTSIADDFNESSPFYDTLGNSILLYPIPDTAITAGLKVFIDRIVAEFTSAEVSTGTKVPGFDVNFHDILPIGMSYDWNYRKKNDKSLMQDIMIMKADLQKHYSAKQKDRQYVMKASNVDYN